jgi:cyclic pyranopterin monophosphate synthase
MVNITYKNTTLRQAIAEAKVHVSNIETIRAIEERRVPKGDIFEFARAAGLLAIKKTSDVVPDCHPLPIEFAAITYQIEDLAIIVRVEAHTIYKTGVEVEAMHGAAITALTMYDMLKPIDKGVEIQHIRLVQKKGGKSDIPQGGPRYKTAVVICSDTVSGGGGDDRTTPALLEQLGKFPLDISHASVVPDEVAAIRAKAHALRAEGYDLVVFAGGTGVSPRDVTPEALEPLLDKPIPGLGEVARAYGQARMPYALLSRGLGGFMGKMLVIAVPGSPKGAAETLDALFPQVLHVFPMVEGKRH